MQGHNQKIIDKNGLQIIKVNKNIFKILFDINNTHIILPKIINFELIKLVYKLNPNIFESVELVNNDANNDKNGNNDENEIIIHSLLKDLFGDLGLPQFYSSIIVTKKSDNETNLITFTCKAFDNKEQQYLYPDDVTILPINDIKIICQIVNNHYVKVFCDVNLEDNHIIPQFAEKIIGNLIYNIFIKVKQFIENITF
jgi:hypothetical protein